LYSTLLVSGANAAERSMLGLGFGQNANQILQRPG
jgi:hypothetical protein